jgi:hypothetical protein
MTDENDYIDLRIKAFNKVPVGSLILVAHHLARERARFLRSLAFGAIEEVHRVIWACLTERPSVTASALDEHAVAVFEEWAKKGAQDAVPHAPYPNSGKPVEKEKQYNILTEAADNRRASKYQAIFNAHAKTWLERRNDQELLRACEVEGRDNKAIEDLLLAWEGKVLVIDDLSALRCDRKKPASLKHCGEHARWLKDLALDNGLVAIAGMPSPVVMKKTSNRKEEESSIGLRDLTVYGSPNESADIVYTMRPSCYPTTYGWVPLQHRYQMQD